MVNAERTVFLIVGNEPYFLDDKIKTMGASLIDADARPLDYKVFCGGETDSKEIIEFARTYPFSGRSRLVVVKECDKLSKDDRKILADYIRKKKSSVPAFLVLTVKDDSLLDEHPSLKDCVKVIRLAPLDESGLSSWVKRSVASRGKAIDADALSILTELWPEDPSSLAQELEKLILFIGERGTIRPEDVEALSASPVSASAFNIADAIAGRDLAKAMKLIGKMSITGKRHHEIIGPLCWHLKRIAQAKILQQEGASPSAIVGRLGVGRRYVGEFLKQLNSFTIAQVKSGIEILLETDAAMKRTRFDPRLLLEIAILRLYLA